ncbi:hypothetical protein PHYSODRAFT_284510 [Phytophthora sojae]|uniref:RxLR effector protein n=2 Tax=Phytophthora sojae TaxID=67593 RepID=G4YL45_PHYSP|nr:hypothetical protein PHYSODRAFT_284510 [Phytophthora sojae]AEK81171.1 Avh325 [Phytophthora sojae]AEK81172.1 Avh325 [Phytophthora sojae]AEK81173.1 Avh325 [Phytophthora sojae]EGZ29800.1 hypothetical protein PHYSODRAFT_284510 [Phytophthora sojae]|eukprot:XP_009517075.1 hypothetical protein PHYSODRAFT_284510 [Phytophthora sojae]
MRLHYFVIVIAAALLGSSTGVSATDLEQATLSNTVPNRSLVIIQADAAPKRSLRAHDSQSEEESEERGLIENLKF